MNRNNLKDDGSPSPDYAERVDRERDAITQSSAHGAVIWAASWVVRSVLDSKRLPPDVYLCTPPLTPHPPSLASLISARVPGTCRKQQRQFDSGGDWTLPNAII